MKLKRFENLDVFSFQEDWEEEPVKSFENWLEYNFPQSYKKSISPDKIKRIDCSNHQITTLKGIEKLPNLQLLDCSRNLLETLSGIESLKHLRELWCEGNNFSDEYREYLKGYCSKNRINLYMDWDQKGSPL